MTCRFLAAWTADAAAPPIASIVRRGDHRHEDLQVDWQTDGEILQQAAQGRSDVTFDFPEDANHALNRVRPARS